MLSAKGVRYVFTVGTNFELVWSHNNTKYQRNIWINLVRKFSWRSEN